jgi:NAD(P)-dependent dehydrogenase (short-subunit alcohol dehydrogenase family)
VSFDLELTGRRALVTAGSKGIGAAVVDVLHNAGATVVATARSTPADARMQQYGHEEACVPLGQTEGRDLTHAFGERHSNSSSATRGSNPLPPLRLPPPAPPSLAPMAR